MSTVKINFPPGLTTKPSGAGLWSPSTESAIDSLRSTSPFGALSFPAPSSTPVAPSPETVFQCQQLTEMIFNSSYPHEQACWVHELSNLTLSLSAQLTASRDALAMEAARSARAQATSEELRKNLTVTEEALATTANMLAVQAANAASAHASLGDERAIASAVIKDLLLKEEALEAATAMLNAQHSNLESVHAILAEKDRKIYEYEKKIRQKNHGIYVNDLEIQGDKRLAGEAINAKISEHHETIARLIAGTGSESSADCGDSEGSESPAGLGSTIIDTKSSALREALAEKVQLLIVEEHRSAMLRNLLNHSIAEVGRLKICLEEAINQVGSPLLENTHPMRSQRSSAQLIEPKEEITDKANLSKVEERSSASLRDLLTQSTMEVGRSKISIKQSPDAEVPPLLGTLERTQDTPYTSTGQRGQRDRRRHQANNCLHHNQIQGLGARPTQRIEDGGIEEMPAPVTSHAHNEEGPINNTDGSESSADDENGSALSTATTQLNNEEPVILHISEGVRLEGEELVGEPTTTTTGVGGQKSFTIRTGGGDFTLSSL